MIWDKNALKDPARELELLRAVYEALMGCGFDRQWLAGAYPALGAALSAYEAGREQGQKECRYACYSCKVIGVAVDEDELCTMCGGNVVPVDGEGRVCFDGKPVAPKPAPEPAGMVVCKHSENCPVCEHGHKDPHEHRDPCDRPCRLNAAVCVPVENVCEHGDHPAPEGQRFCSEACQRCELESTGDTGCDGICGLPVPAPEEEKGIVQYVWSEEGMRKTLDGLYVLASDYQRLREQCEGYDRERLCETLAKQQADYDRLRAELQLAKLSEQQADCIDAVLGGYRHSGESLSEAVARLRAENERLKQQVAEKDQEIGEYQGEHELNDKQIAKLTSDLATREERIKVLSGLLHRVCSEGLTHHSPPLLIPSADLTVALIAARAALSPEQKEPKP